MRKAAVRHGASRMTDARRCVFKINGESGSDGCLVRVEHYRDGVRDLRQEATGGAAIVRRYGVDADPVLLFGFGFDHVAHQHCRYRGNHLAAEIRLEPGSIQDEAPFGGRESLPFSGFKVCQIELSNARTHEPQSRMPNGGGHATYLAVFSFNQFQPDPAGGDGFAETNGRIAWRQFRLRIKHPRAG